MQERYDAIIIGAGMSGMAAGIRLAAFGKRVCVLEKHSVPGGLNSYYQRGSYALDVGLHALTNFTPPQDKNSPLGKVVKQLRIPYENFRLSQQKSSKIVFPNATLSFSNDFQQLIDGIAHTFPQEIDGFLKLVDLVKNFNPFHSSEFISAKSIVSQYLKDRLLLEMIFTPILIYGSAHENDLDFPQFVIMFRSLFLEGLSRPWGGVRTIINILNDRAKEVGLEIFFKTSVKKILHQNQQVLGVELSSNETILSKKIFSSAGYAETLNLMELPFSESLIGQMSFCESLMVFDKKPHIESSLIFYNENSNFHYQKPQTPFDPSSAVLCFPNNFSTNDLDYPMVRVTSIANFDSWIKEDRKTYLLEKEKVLINSLDIIKKNDPHFKGNLIFSDVFTPKTIKRYTHHLGGAVYGSPKKIKDGRTSIQGVFIIGTDQGFLGIIGSLLSGISMANLHGLLEGQNGV